MTQPLVLLNVVGLAYEMIGEHTPHLKKLADQGFARPLGTVLPAVTCSAQSTLLTGTLPNEHGIVGNGWYDRDLAEVLFWKQSNRLVSGERVYQTARKKDPRYTTAKLFWWYNMYAPVEWSVTPRPSYPADGRKVFDSYSFPPELKDRLQNELGVFPLLRFWGPGADIASSRWIADATIRTLQWHRPSLTLVYLPHLDYNLQRLGPNDPAIDQDLQSVDAEAGRIIDAAEDAGALVVVVSEYAIMPVTRPVHINRVLRNQGLLSVRREPTGWETLDMGASRAFAVSDHQIAHVYIRDQNDIALVSRILKQTPGIEDVLSDSDKTHQSLNHKRSGELIAISEPDSWFTYYFWVDDALAPDYARTVDIHRKPGYDPVELFYNPSLRFPMLRMAQRLARKKLGFRYYMDIIGLDGSQVKGSHGRLPRSGHETSEGPVFIASSKRLLDQNPDLPKTIPMTSVKELILKMQFG